MGRERGPRGKSTQHTAHSSRWWCGGLRVCFACRFEPPRAGRGGNSGKGGPRTLPLHLQQHAGRRQWRRLVFRPYLRYVLRTSILLVPVLPLLHFLAKGKKEEEERLWILAFIARSDAPHHHRSVSLHRTHRRHSARPDAREAFEEGRKEIRFQPSRELRAPPPAPPHLQPLASASLRLSSCVCVCLWCGLPLTWRGRRRAAPRR